MASPSNACFARTGDSTYLRLYSDIIIIKLAVVVVFEGGVQ